MSYGDKTYIGIAIGNWFIQWATANPPGLEEDDSHVFMPAASQRVISKRQLRVHLPADSVVLECSGRSRRKFVMQACVQ